MMTEIQLNLIRGLRGKCVRMKTKTLHCHLQLSSYWCLLQRTNWRQCFHLVNETAVAIFRYNKTVEACALNTDFDTFISGDLTEVTIRILVHFVHLFCKFTFVNAWYVCVFFCVYMCMCMLSCRYNLDMSRMGVLGCASLSG